jgi:PAS domain S-box-containing protein
MKQHTEVTSVASTTASEGVAKLRQRVEEKLAPELRERLEKIESADIEWLVHELGVHQVELEAQNEELLRNQTALEEARDRYLALYHQAPIGYVTISLNGRIVESNAMAAQMLGTQPGQLHGRRFADHFVGGDRLLFQKTCNKLLLEQVPARLDLRLVPTRGVPLWVNLSISVATETRQLRQYRIALLDITSRMKVEEERAQLAGIVASSNDAIIGRDLEGRVTSWNGGAELMLDFKADEMIGKPLDAVVSPHRLSDEVERVQRVRNGGPVGPYETELRNRRGLAVPVLVSLSTVRNEAGHVVGFSTIARDISERKRIERSLHKRLRQLDLLSQAGQVLIMAEPGATPMQHELFDRVRLAVGGEICMIFRMGAKPGTLELVSEHGLSEKQRSALSVIAFEDSLSGLAASRRAPLIAENLQSSGLPQAHSAEAVDVRSFAAFPLLAHGDVYGVAAFASTTRDHFRDGDLQVIQTVCDQVAAMLARGRLLDELHQREDSLRLADRRKDDFIATLAHELRNPLAPIRNALGILRQSSLADPQLAWCRDVIERQVTHVTRLLEDLLDVSRVTRNKIDLRSERIELQRVLDEAVEVTRPLIDAQRHTLTVSVPAEPIIVYGDMTRLTQVLGNLLNNAAKYTDVGGSIQVVMQREGHEVSISVRDSGIGIEPKQVPLVFDMFAQLKPALERSRGGLGIGLALSRGMIELHGGRIEARSEGAGRGSEFIVWLPIVHHAAERLPEPVRDTNDVIASQTGRRVLVVDDNADAAQTLATMLGLSGFDTRLAFGGREGLRIAEDWHPDVAIVDIGMPHFNGYELCRRIREQPWGERMLMIACTGWGQNEDRQRARLAGFDVHLVKPIEPDEVLRIVGGNPPLEEGLQ